MSDDVEHKASNSSQPVATKQQPASYRERPVLDSDIQSHLGQELRSTYARVADKPAYLGDPALPPEFEHKLIEVEAAVELREKGIEAVREVLNLPDEAHEKGLDAVKNALLPDPPSRK